MATYTLKGKNVRIERDTFRAHSLAFGVKVEAIGQKITLKGREFIVDGMNPNFANRPFIVKRDDGVRFPIHSTTLRDAIDPAFITKRSRKARVDLGIAHIPVDAI